MISLFMLVRADRQDNYMCSGRDAGGSGGRDRGACSAGQCGVGRRGARRHGDEAMTPTEHPLQRCRWAGTDPQMRDYHDQEWGVPERDSRALWEKLMLDGFQAGLAWITVLRKREAFRQAFAGFDPERVARFDDRDIERLLGNAGIIRSRAKIEATIGGARSWCAMAERGEDFSAFCWGFTDGQPLLGDGHQLPTSTPLSGRISRELKQRGFKFVGPTIVYAWMQAVGMVNDHAADCFRRASPESRRG